VAASGSRGAEDAGGRASERGRSPAPRLWDPARIADPVDIGRVELAVESAGEGPAVVFVHGLGGVAEAWRGQLDRFGGPFRAIAYDQRGAGRSDRPPGPYSVEGWAADLVALLDTLGVERAALVGHSVGCMVAEHAALALEGRCAALAMLGGAPAWPEQANPVFEERARLARGGRLREVAEAVSGTGLSERAHAERPELVARMVEMVAANDPEAYAESALATGRGSMLDPERVSCPALAFCGEEDVVTPVAASEAIASAIPGGRSAVVAGGAHWCHLELPDAVNKILLDFLQAVETG
jgi:3-oxoadipate enol-lactonase